MRAKDFQIDKGSIIIYSTAIGISVLSIIGGKTLTQHWQNTHGLSAIQNNDQTLHSIKKVKSSDLNERPFSKHKSPFMS